MDSFGTRSGVMLLAVRYLFTEQLELKKYPYDI
jgi:hypothetical protein